MDEKVRTAADDYENPKDFSNIVEWRWWRNALGVVIVFAIVVLISRW